VDHAAAVALQRAWRKRSAYVFVKDLKQEKLCRDMREEMRAGLHVDCEACSSAGKKSADIRSRNQKKAWKDADELLFKGMARVQMSDRGDNWNERWQEALSLPNKTKMDITYKRRSLDAVYSDFVHTAVTYGRTIISEYFLHEYMKSVKPKRLGGVAGGKKYLWRGILFKLADGSQGPYGGSDEAAAKAAGHELRGASEYLSTGVGLCVPPMCLLDYKGFRMLAQAHLPLGATSLKMGTNDGGRTVLNDCPILDKRTAMAAKTLGLRAHIGPGDWIGLQKEEKRGGTDTPRGGGRGGPRGDRFQVEVVVRTLKLVLREFQRRWMKSEQSSSERGMHLLVTQFLNLVTGHHERSHLFWRENVTTGVFSRPFGTVALTESERAGLWTVCSERPEILLTIVKELVKVTGVR
ncbi:unnamed protein product, partial [Ectocarpus fasciculatus]